MPNKFLATLHTNVMDLANDGRQRDLGADSAGLRGCRCSCDVIKSRGKKNEESPCNRYGLRRAEFHRGSLNVIVRSLYLSLLLCVALRTDRLNSIHLCDSLALYAGDRGLCWCWSGEVDFKEIRDITGAIDLWVDLREERTLCWICWGWSQRSCRSSFALGVGVLEVEGSNAL